MKKLLMILLVCNGLFSSESLKAQVTLSAQLRTRTEVRDGYGAPLHETAKPAFFTSQRTRLSLGHSGYRFRLGITAQDVRVWGQDQSTINRTTMPDVNGLMLHEAWAELQLTDTGVKRAALSLKIGRQELVYDDARLLGNLDWLQQGRRHDAAVLKLENSQAAIHLGAAFNQHRENSAGTIYNTHPNGYAGNTNGGAMYKSMQLLYATRKFERGNFSYMFFADQFSRFRNDTLNQVPVKTYEARSWKRYTTGIYFNNMFGKTGFTAAAYYQFGHYDADRKLAGFLLSGFLHNQLTSPLNVGAGIDYTSGGSSSQKHHSFDPLYGTPHKFWGLMDYFYAGSPFGKTGLVDYYLKTKWKASTKLSFAADLHQFTSASGIMLPDGVKPENNKYGQEVDLVTNITLTSQISVEAGYARFFATSLLTSQPVKNVADAKLNSNWAYVMVSIKPEYLFNKM